MFGIGLTEMILVGIVILLLFSPRELPGMLKAIAQVYGSIRRTAEEFRAQVMEAEELREPIEEIRAAYHGTKQELASAQNLARRELARARSEALKAQQRLGQLVREEHRRDVPPVAAHPALQGRVAQDDDRDDDDDDNGDDRNHNYHQHDTGGLEPDPQAAHPQPPEPLESGGTRPSLAVAPGSGSSDRSDAA